jgi:hypothetical protein
VESPLRCEPHGGFGERPEKTDREQSRHRASGQLTDEPLFPPASAEEDDNVITFAEQEIDHTCRAGEEGWAVRVAFITVGSGA